jgi:hypothetical protein
VFWSDFEELVARAQPLAAARRTDSLDPLATARGTDSSRAKSIANYRANLAGWFKSFISPV